MRKAQTFYWDFIAGVLIFGLIIIAFFKFSPSILSSEGTDIDSLLFDARKISSDLVLAGHPSNWTAADAERIGITDGKYRVLDSKLELFNTMDYSKAKLLLGTRYDFIFFFKDNSNNVIDIALPSETKNTFGMPDVNHSTVQDIEGISDLVKIDRYVIYNSSMHEMTLYVWSRR